MSGFVSSNYHRLSNAALGTAQVLDVRSDGTGYLMMVAAADVAGQHWRLVDLGNDAWALRTWYLGDGLSLSTDGANRPLMSETSESDSQHWSVSLLGDGTYRLSPATGASGKALGTAPGTNEPVASPDDPSQHWTIRPSSPVWPNVPVPPLDPGANTQPWEAPTDYSFYRGPSGTVSARDQSRSRQRPSAPTSAGAGI